MADPDGDARHGRPRRAQRRSSRRASSAASRPATTSRASGCSRRSASTASSAWPRTESSQRVRDRHLRAIADLAEAAERELVGPDDEAAGSIGSSSSTTTCGLRCAGHLESGQAEIGMLTAGRIWRFWHQRGHLGEGLAITRELLACPDARGVSPGRAKALNGAGGLAYWQNDFPAAGRFYAEQLEAVDGARETRPASPRRTTTSATSRPSPATMPRAIEHYEQALAIWRELGDGFGLASGLARAGARAVPEARLGPCARGGPRGAGRRPSASATGIVGRASWASSGRVAMENGRLPARTRRAAWRPSSCSPRSADPTGVSMQLDDLGDLAMARGRPGPRPALRRGIGRAPGPGGRGSPAGVDPSRRLHQRCARGARAGAGRGGLGGRAGHGPGDGGRGCAGGVRPARRGRTTAEALGLSR